MMSNRRGSGSCLCGQVRFEIEGDFDRFFFCHCQRCRKASGTAHGANLFSATAKVTWLSGEDLVTQYRVPDTRFARACAHLGFVRLPAGRADDDVQPAFGQRIEVAADGVRLREVDRDVDVSGAGEHLLDGRVDLGDGRDLAPVLGRELFDELSHPSVADEQQPHACTPKN